MGIITCQNLKVILAHLYKHQVSNIMIGTRTRIGVKLAGFGFCKGCVHRLHRTDGGYGVFIYHHLLAVTFHNYSEVIKAFHGPLKLKAVDQKNSHRDIVFSDLV